MAIVHVIGTGTIGEPLIGLLADHRDDFGIEEVTFHKRHPSAESGRSGSGHQTCCPGSDNHEIVSRRRLRIGPVSRMSVCNKLSVVLVFG